MLPHLTETMLRLLARDSSLLRSLLHIPYWLATNRLCCPCRHRQLLDVLQDGLPQNGGHDDQHVMKPLKSLT